MGAHDKKLNEDVVVKVFPTESTESGYASSESNDAIVQEAKDECEKAKNIQTMELEGAKETEEARKLFMKCRYRFNKDVDELAFVVYDLIEGKTMFDAIKQGELKGYDTIIKVSYDLFLGLSLIQHTYVHNDIEPENLMYTSEHRSVYIDFGGMRKIGKPVQAYTRMYSAPELALMKDDRRFRLSHPRLDVYGAGSVLWAAICGRPLKDVIQKEKDKVDEKEEKKRKRNAEYAEEKERELFEDIDVDLMYYISEEK